MNYFSQHHSLTNWANWPGGQSDEGQSKKNGQSNEGQWNEASQKKELFLELFLQNLQQTREQDCGPIFNSDNSDDAYKLSVSSQAVNEFAGIWPQAYLNP